MGRMGIIVVGLVITASTIGAMAYNKMRITTSCKDVRLYMDDGIYAHIKTGGLQPRTQVSVLKLKAGKLQEIANYEVKGELSQKNGMRYQKYSSPEMKLEINDSKVMTDQSHLGQIEGSVAGQKYFAQLKCSQK